MRFSEARGHKVVSIATAETVGKVDGFVVSPQDRAVVALTLKKTDGDDVLRWPDLAAFGADAVTVSDASQIGPEKDDLALLAGKDGQLLGKRVLSTRGDELGKVADVAFDPETGRLTELLLSDTEVAAERLIGVGPYAVVVQAE